MRVRQVTKILFVMFPCLRASSRHGGARRFYYLYSLKPPRGRPFEGRRRSIVPGGMGASAPILIICPIHALPIFFRKATLFWCFVILWIFYLELHLSCDASHHRWDHGDVSFWLPPGMNVQTDRVLVHRWLRCCCLIHYNPRYSKPTEPLHKEAPPGIEVFIMQGVGENFAPRLCNPLVPCAAR